MAKVIRVRLSEEVAIVGTYISPGMNSGKISKLLTET